MYEALERSFGHPDFVEKIQRAKEQHASAGRRPAQGSEVLQEDWWQEPPESPDTATQKSAPEVAHSCQALKHATAHSLSVKPKSSADLMLGLPLLSSHTALW